MTTLADDTGRETAPPNQRTSKARLSDRARAERSLGWRLAGPAFIIMLAVTAYPIINALWLSLYNYRLTDPSARSFVFLRNYVVILTDSLWWAAVGITVIITLVTVVVEFVLGMALAMVMNKIVIPRRSLRTIILIPYAIITVVSAFSWKYAFAVDSGYANHWLHTLTFGAFPLTYDWFGGTWSSLAIICLSEIWKTTPFMSLLLLAGLSQVSEDMLEAAQVDGASWTQRLVRVILPNMRAAIMVAVLFRALDAFRIFDNIYVMTKGAQNTESSSFLTYRQVIEQFQLGMGSALSVLLFISVLILAFGIVKLFGVDLAQARGES